MSKRSRYLLLTLILFVYSACATGSKKGENPAAAKEDKISSTALEVKTSNAAISKVQAVPEFVPVSEELSPLKTRIVSISARNTPLKDVLFVVSEATGLNLVMDSGVNPELSVTLTLKNVNAEDALIMISSSADYFYSVKGNVLTVKAMDTRIFEFGQPSVIQDYSVNIGGDILGGASSGSSGNSGVKGNVTQSVQSDKEASKLWDSIEKTIGSMIGASAASTSTSTATPASAETAKTVQTVQERPEQQSRVNVNRMTGTIVVTASKKNMQKTANYLSRLRSILGRQVIIETRVVEVQLSKSLKYGIDWSILGNAGNLNITSITPSANKFTDVVSQTAPNFQIGVIGTSFSSLLSALQTQGDIKVLSNPRINIMNGQTALLSVGRDTTYISKVETTTTPGSAGVAATTTFTVSTQSILSGMMIGMAPVINENREISMAITPIISDLVKLEERTIGVTGQNTAQISLPTVDLRELNTTVKIKDGEMVVIGGLIQNKERIQDNYVPFLGQIPFLGYLFKSRETINDKTELVIMLKPTVVGF